MAGEISFGLHDPNAFLRGAQTMNTMMGNLAKKRAGKKMAAGDMQGGVGELYREGMIDEGQRVQHNETANQAQAWGLDESKRKSNAEMARDVATALDNVRMQQGDAAVLPAFEQLLPAFRAQGIPDAQIEQYRQGLAQNPGAFVSAMSRHANDYLQRYGFVQTPQGIYQTDKFTGRVDRKVGIPRYLQAPRDSSIVQLPDPEATDGTDTSAPAPDFQQPPQQPQGGALSTEIPPDLSPEERAAYQEYLRQVQNDPDNIQLLPDDPSQSPQYQNLPMDPSQPPQIQLAQQGTGPRAFGGGRVIAEGRQTPRAAYRLLTPEEAKTEGYRPGTTVQVNTATGQRSVVQGPPGAGSGTGAGGRPARLSVQETAELVKARTANAQVRNMLPLLDEFVRLNKDNETGGSYAIAKGMPGGETALKLLGGDAVVRMNTIASQLTPAMRNGLPGAASDRDVALFQDATLGVDKSRAVNAQIERMTRAAVIRMGDYQAFREAYARANNTLLGAEEKWAEYANAYPLFNEPKQGQTMPTLNTKIPPWRQVLDTKMPEEGAPAGDEDDIDSLLEMYK